MDIEDIWVGATVRLKVDPNKSVRWSGTRCRVRVVLDDTVEVERYEGTILTGERMWALSREISSIEGLATARSHPIQPVTAPNEESMDGGASLCTLDGGAVLRTSDTGGQKGDKLARFDMMNPDVLRQLAEHFGKGARKYSDVDGIPNWRRGYDWSLSYAALQRHANLFWGGEDIDPETGSHHLIAVMWHCMALVTWGEEHPEFDDRASKRVNSTDPVANVQP